MSWQELEPNSLFDLSQYEHQELFKNCSLVWNALDNIADYLKNYPLGLHQGSVSERAYLVNPDQIFIGEGAVIEPGAYVKGPCIIGNYTTVRHGAYVRGHVITGSDCVIGHTTEIKNSILLNKAQAAHFSYVGDSIIGNNVNLGAGAKLANLLFSKKNIHIFMGSEKVLTGRRKLGAILGDDVQLGCNSVTSPGTVISKRSQVCPCINVKGFVSEDQVVRESAQKKHVYS